MKIIKNLNIYSVLYFLVYALFFFILAQAVSKLFLYLDDVSYIFPSIIGDYQSHFAGYLRDNGFNRPVALLYYYSIFKIYLSRPVLAHLFPLILLFISSIILRKILINQGISRWYSLLASLWMLSIPFMVEIYTWFSASIGSVALLIFMLQVYLIEYQPNEKSTAPAVFLLQSISSFSYETTLFMPLALAYLYLIKRKIPITFQAFKYYLKYMLIFIIPTFFYIIIKISIPHSIPSEFEIGKLPEIFSNFQNQMDQLYELFWTKGPANFWYGETISGLKIIINNDIFSSFSVALTGILVYLLLDINSRREKGDAVNNIDDKKDLFNEKKSLFWLMAFFSSLIPLIWKKYYLPFRTFYLPTLLLGIFMVFITVGYIRKRKIVFSYNIFLVFGLVTIALLLLSLSLQIKMVDNYRQQYLDDEKMINEIRVTTEYLGYTSENRSNLLLLNMFNSTVFSYRYGDYILSMFANEWSAAGFVDLNSGTIKKIGIEKKEKNIFSSDYSRSYFEALRPLTILKFRGVDSCRQNNCFDLIRSFQ